MRSTRPGQSALLLLDAVEILQRENVQYVVIGAFALAVHGVVRASTDADVLLFITAEHLAALQSQFDRAGFRTELRRGGENDSILSMLILRDGINNRVDVLGGLRGMDPGALDRTVEVPFFGVNVRFVGREDFIAMKCFAGGPQDILDAKSTLRGAQGSVNLDLLRALTRRFGRDAADNLERVLTN